MASITIEDSLIDEFNDSIETGDDDTLLTVVKEMIVSNILEQIQKDKFGRTEITPFGIIYNKTTNANEYLKPAVFYALEKLCNDDNFQEKYQGVPEKVLKDIFTGKNIYGHS